MLNIVCSNHYVPLCSKLSASQRCTRSCPRMQRQSISWLALLLQIDLENCPVGLFWNDQAAWLKSENNGFHCAQNCQSRTPRTNCCVHRLHCSLPLDVDEFGHLCECIGALAAVNLSASIKWSASLIIAHKSRIVINFATLNKATSDRSINFVSIQLCHQRHN